jgi:hypothetical protein
LAARARTRLFELIATPNRALRAPPPAKRSFAVAFSSPKNKKMIYFQKQNASLQTRARAAKSVFHMSFHWNTEALKNNIS